jgi:hypothetical protein
MRATTSGATRGSRGHLERDFRRQKQSESLPVPSQQRLGLDQQQGMPPLTMEAREQHEQASLVDAKGRAFDGA